MIKKAQTYANTARYFVHSQYQQSNLNIPLVSSDDVGSVDEARFDNILSRYDDDVVFVHAGLSDVKSAFGTNPYEFLLDKLDEHFESILAPGFTPSFRSTGIYHKKFSRPEVGTFSRLFLEDADYRTNDAIHSILVRGKYRFSDYDHRESFSENGCWSKLDEENVLYLNIGTPWLISTHHHFIEHTLDVPYIETVLYDGVLYRDESEWESIRQCNYTYQWPIKRNSKKIQKYLTSQMSLSKYNLNGLKLMFFRTQDVKKVLEPKIKADPYYLVK